MHSWRSYGGPAMGKNEQSAYEDYCRMCLDVWGAQPASFENWLQTTNYIGVTYSPAVAEHGLPVLRKV